MEKKDAKILVMDHATETPADVAISRCVQNMFATYGEKKVRQSLKELFGVNTKTSKKRKAA